MKQNPEDIKRKSKKKLIDPKNWGAGQKAVYSMWANDYQRFHDMYVILDRVMIKIKSGDYRYLWKCYSVLHQIYLNFRYFTWPEDRKTIENLFDETEEAIITFRSKMNAEQKAPRPVDILYNLNEIFMLLSEVKQKSGFGIDTSRTYSREQRAHRIAD